MKSEEQKGFIVAIDGPVASGKGTIAKDLASITHGFYLNTGALFRMLTLYALDNGVEFKQEPLLKLLSSLELDLQEDRALLNGVDVSDRIYKVEISRKVALIAEMTEVHKKIMLLERKIGELKAREGKVIIIEGRNIGTTVFPNADVKIFMTATVEKRTERRLKQSHTRKENIDFKTVLADTMDRDERDMSRIFAPLVRNPKEQGYFLLDNTDLTQEQTLELIVKQLEKKGLKL